MFQKTFIHNNSELERALIYVWVICAMIGLVILLAPFWLGDNMIVIPACTSKLNGGECFLCGSTRAFLAISKLDFLAAYGLNKLSLLIYSIFLVNPIILITYFFKSNFKTII